MIPGPESSPVEGIGYPLHYFFGFPGGSDGNESACSVGDLGSIPGLGRSPGAEHGNLPPVFLIGESHEQRSLAGYSPWGRKEADMTKHSTHLKNTNWQLSSWYRVFVNFISVY